MGGSWGELGWKRLGCKGGQLGIVKHWNGWVGRDEALDG